MTTAEKKLVKKVAKKSTVKAKAKPAKALPPTPENKRVATTARTLQPRHKDFIYHHLALGRGNLEICELFGREYVDEKLTIHESTIRKFYANQKDKILAKRQELLENLELITPLALEQRRLAELQDLYEDAKRLGEGVIEGLVRVAAEQMEDKDSGGAIETIGKIAKEAVSADASRVKTRTDLLKQIDQMIKPLRIQVEDKTPKSKSMKLNWNMKNVNSAKLKEAIPALEELMKRTGVDVAEINAIEP